jgi:hypothetical protein
METREEVSEDELLKILNEELFKHPALKECNFTFIRRSEPDKAGCNWSAAVTSSGAPLYISAPVTGKIVSEAQKKYNVKWKHGGSADHVEGNRPIRSGEGDQRAITLRNVVQNKKIRV